MIEELKILEGAFPAGMTRWFFRGMVEVTSSAGKKGVVAFPNAYYPEPPPIDASTREDAFQKYDGKMKELAEKIRKTLQDAEDRDYEQKEREKSEVQASKSSSV